MIKLAFRRPLNQGRVPCFVLRWVIADKVISISILIFLLECSLCGGHRGMGPVYLTPALWTSFGVWNIFMALYSIRPPALWSSVFMSGYCFLGCFSPTWPAPLDRAGYLTPSALFLSAAEAHIRTDITEGLKGGLIKWQGEATESWRAQD